MNRYLHIISRVPLFLNYIVNLIKFKIIKMNTPEIIPNVYYTGVDDHTTHLFEGLWQIPWGVSYNSYVVRGEKTALIDGVELHKVEELIRQIDNSAFKPDYLVVNHMEPDHSGAIPALVANYPAIKIIGNNLTVGMIKAFYHIEDPDRFIIVKDGDAIDLGKGMVMKFYLAPMLHWPETMVTYLEGKGLLFSGDAFGTFGALDGAVEDTQLDDRSMYFEEMRRYYAAIVAKYGKPVQNALAKLSGLEITRICPTHGPIWHKYIAEVIKAYDDMSIGRTEPGVVIAYGSMYGNTGCLAETVARRLHEKGVKNVRLYNLSNTEQSRVLADIWRFSGLVLASPTYNANIFPPVESLIKALEVRDLKNRVVGVLGSYAWAPASAKLIASRVEAMGLDLAGSVVMKMSQDAQTRKEAESLADKLAEKVLGGVG